MHPILACANAMEGGGLNPQQILLVTACAMGIVVAICLFLYSSSKRRAAEKRERFKDLDGDA